jgi:hypothetical protein
MRLLTRRSLMVAVLIGTTAGLGASGVAAAGAAPMTASPVVRSMRVAVVMLRLPGSTAEPVSKTAVQSAMFGATKSVADWFSQMSGGQVAVTGTVYGYYGGVSSCDLTTQLAAGAAAAAQGGYVASDYTNLVVYAPNQSCGFSGMAWIGASGVFLNGSVLPGVIEHELGHNLGLMHAGESACGTAAVSAGCVNDYADPTDVMGNPSVNHGYSAEHKYTLGWIPAAEVQTVTAGTRTIALTAAENPLGAGSTELIHVRAADGTLFAVDRRASVGYDAGLSGVWIREVAKVGTDDTVLLRGSALPAGQAYTDAAHKVTIKVLTDSGKSASVQVCVGPCPSPVTTQKIPVPAATITARNIATASRRASANAGITLVVRPGHGVAAGHTIIVSTYASKAAGPVSCHDSRGNTYGVSINSRGAQRLIVCSAHASAGLAPGATITIRYPSFNGSSASSANDFSGVRATARVDKATVAGANRSAIDSGRTTRTTQPAELVFGVVIHRGLPRFTAGPGYRPVGAVAYGSEAARITINPVFKIVSTTGAFNLAGTLSAAQQWRAAVVTFFEA